MVINIEKCKEALVADLQDNPYSLNDPIGTNLSYQKIKHYLFACVINGIEKPECVDWLYDLYKKQIDDDRAKFRDKIDLLANCLYHFYDELKTK